MKILVTGANGQLGQEIKALVNLYPQADFFFYTRTELDIASQLSVDSIFDQVQPDYCINCAAYTAVDRAEQETDQAFRINAEGVKNLAKTSKNLGCRLIHISTDYVFNGEGEAPYLETDSTAPMGAYGESKLKGEVLCLEEDPSAVIIRTAWVFSSYGNNFVKTMLRLMPVKESLSVVADQHGCPTYAADLAAAILQVIISGNWHPGIYHYSNSKPTTWFDFAAAIQSHCGFACTVNPINTDQYPTPAKRPKYSVLHTSKIQETYGVKIRIWEEALNDCLSLLNCQV